MTDASTQSPVSRWILVVFTAALGVAALWLAARLVAPCLADAPSGVSSLTSGGACGGSGRPTVAVIGGVIVIVMAIALLVVTAVAPPEARSRLFALLYTCLVTVALLAIVATVSAGGFSLPPNFNL